MKNDSIVIRRTYNASAEKIWQAITDRNQMKQWYFEMLETFEPKAGFTTRFNVPHEGKNFVHVWKVTEVVPGKKISYEWKYEGYPGNSLVTFELNADEGKTMITLTHENLDTFLPGSNPELSGENFKQGWTSLIGSSLKTFLEGPPKA